MMIHYSVPNTNTDFYFNPRQIAKIFCESDKLIIRIQMVGDSNYETLIFLTEKEYFSFRQRLLDEVV